jgi:flavin reductase (DIM6/NTAB) family NADH-FMN oxidoreductase RutF
MNAHVPQPFDPSTDAHGFRGALGSFVTGVTVVTTQGDEGPVAIVANSFASVSLDPPLVLWSPAKASRRFRHFADAPRFAIHVLAADQRDVCTAIVKSKTAISEVAMQLSACGMPIIDGALATFECTLQASHDAGDHIIVVGRVMKAHHRNGEPLVFHGGVYGKFRQD